LVEVEGIADDNMTITGWGYNPDGAPEAFIARLPEPASLLGLLVLVGLIRRLR
jgi:hypothetical protein